MPRILVLADCSSEIADSPIVLDEECSPRAWTDRKAASRVLARVGSAVAEAHEVEESREHTRPAADRPD